MAQQLRINDPARIQHYELNLSAVRNVERDVFSKTKADWVGMPGLEAGREEVIAAGILMLRCVMEELKARRCLVSEYGLRECISIILCIMGPECFHLWRFDKVVLCNYR